jgi:hypothetical protein
LGTLGDAQRGSHNSEPTEKGVAGYLANIVGRDHLHSQNFSQPRYINLQTLIRSIKHELMTKPIL